MLIPQSLLSLVLGPLLDHRPFFQSHRLLWRLCPPCGFSLTLWDEQASCFPVHILYLTLGWGSSSSIGPVVELGSEVALEPGHVGCWPPDVVWTLAPCCPAGVGVFTNTAGLQKLVDIIQVGAGFRL